MSRQKLVELHTAVAAELKRVYAGRSTGSATISIGQTNASKEKLENLKPIQIAELDIKRDVHRGRVLICRNITIPLKYTAIATIIEDSSGNATRLSLYNFTTYQECSPDMSSVVPVGAVLAIMEPYYKVAGDGKPALRVDNPTDVVFLKKDDPLMATLTWAYPPPATSASTQPQDAPQTPEDHKQLGDACFKSKAFAEALLHYSNGLSLQPMHTVLLLNRAACHLELQHYEEAIEDCDAALAQEPANQKGLYRKARALALLGRWEEALQVAEEALTATTGGSEVQKLHQQLRTACQEAATGEYDMVAMWQEATRSGRSARLEYHADFHGPVRIARIPGAGRGVVATEDLRPGQLVAACRATTIVFPWEAMTNPTTSINLGSFEMVDPGNSQLLPQLTQLCIHNPSIAAKVRQLYAGPAHPNPSSTDLIVSAGGPAARNPAELRRPPTTKARRPPDASLLNGAIHYNCFGWWDLNDTVPKRRGTIASQAEMAHNDSSGLWLLPSLFNHACAANCSSSFVGDFMFITAAMPVAAGTELTLSYIAAEQTLAQRRDKLDKHGFVCRCAKCMDDLSFSAQPYQVHESIRRLTQEIETEIRPKLDELLKLRSPQGLLEGTARASGEELLPRLKDVASELEQLLSARSWKTELQSPLSMLVCLSQLLGQYQDAAASGERLYELVHAPKGLRPPSAFGSVAAFKVAEANVAAGDIDAARAWLEKSVEHWTQLCGSRELFSHLHKDILTECLGLSLV